MKSGRPSCRMLMVGLVAAMVVFMLGAGVAWPQELTLTATQTAMRDLFVVLSDLYRYSLNADAFEDQRNRDDIGRLLNTLARDSQQLKEHGGDLDPSFDFVRRSFALDANDALKGFREANYAGSRYIVGQITENCVTCHTKLPAGAPFEAGKEFLDAVRAKSFPPAVRAKLEVATCQFSDAMKTYEQTFLSPGVTADDLARFNTFENYLRVSIGSLSDAKRPVPALEQFTGRAEMPAALKAEAGAWIASLQAMNLAVAKGEELAAARRLVAGAREKTTSRSDQSQMANFIGAITLLHGYLRSRPQDDVSTAEAYYLLGVAESYVSHSYWISETDYLLEKSIRRAPKSEVARQALAFLEDYRREGSATPTRPVPTELQTDIEELRKLTKP